MAKKTRKLPPPKDGIGYDATEILGNVTPTGEKRGEWVNAHGGDFDMHAEMLGDDDLRTTNIPLHPPTKGR